MAQYDFDLFTIGAGSGGVAGSRRAASHGARVAICEESRVGGTCVMRGCVPKKLLIYGAHYRDELQDAVGFGWKVGETQLDWGALVAAKDAELDRLEGIYHRMLNNSGVTLLEGRGRICDPHTVEVGGKRYTAERIMVATGGWPDLPEVPGIENVITSNEALDLKTLPARIAIVGGGYIAVEFAGIFEAAGAEVTLIVRGDKVLRGFDEDIRDGLTEALGQRGIHVLAQTEVASIRKESGGLALALNNGEEVHVDQAMYATGRLPNSRGIGLEEAGVKVDWRGAVVVDEWNRSSVPHIYAVGDVTHRLNLTPVAIAEGRAVAETLFNDNPQMADHEGVPTAVFSQPPIATVGHSESAALAHCGCVDVYLTRFRPMKHTISGREERILMKLIVEHESQRVVGCHMLGDDAPEIIQGLAVALKAGACKADFDATVGIHPTAAEEFVTLYTKTRTVGGD